MAKGNARGARYDIKAASSGDISKTIAITSNGSAYDLTNTTASIVVKDEQGQVRTEVLQTVTDAVGGLINLFIPNANFQAKEGELLTYEFNLTEGGATVTYMHGIIDLWEML